MLELFGSGLMTLWLEMSGVQVKPLEAINALTWQTGPSLAIAPDPNPVGATTVQKYLEGLVKSKLIGPELIPNQGIWIQSGPMLIANHQGTTPLPAASITKIATSLAAFNILGPEFQFETVVSATGPIHNGVLAGDLVIAGNGDPMLVWEEGIALGNALNKMGIKEVKGSLIVAGNLAFNFQTNPALAGQLLKEVLDHTTWRRGVELHLANMAKGTPKPQVVIKGDIKQAATMPAGNILIRHRSLPVKQIINEMNVFSNNDIAQMLADAVGGHTVVQAEAAKLAKVPQSEIQLINGSGLGVENRISPRAACAMIMALQRIAAPHKMTISDMMPTAGYDSRGTSHARRMPKATPFKTGTLRDVSALAGVLPTRDRGLVWFAIINRGPQVMAFRQEQDKFLVELQKKLYAGPSFPKAIAPLSTPKKLPEMGAKSRMEIVNR